VSSLAKVQPVEEIAAEVNVEAKSCRGRSTLHPRSKNKIFQNKNPT